jgi:hypothetical protein
MAFGIIESTRAELFDYSLLKIGCCINFGVRFKALLVTLSGKLLEIPEKIGEIEQNFKELSAPKIVYFTTPLLQKIRYKTRYTWFIYCIQAHGNGKEGTVRAAAEQQQTI